ncbi:MAG TPA: aldo/keto reductase [Vicinamibacterales bacterium]|nr:aldo/keto reductase [Vicinamibacterales bacterium]
MRSIPSSGESIPAIGLGTWQTFDVGSDRSRRTPLRTVLQAFVQLGGRVIDSSPMYGTSESVVGDLAADLDGRDQLFLATKVWTTGKAAGVRQIEESMRRLRTERLDLLQIHNLVDARTQLDTLRGLKRDGRIRYIGVTHYTAAGAEAIAQFIASEAVDTIQINYSAVERAAEERLLDAAHDRGIAVIVNRPLGGEGGGRLRRLATRPLPAWAGEIECTSWAQLLLKFVVSHPAVTCAIPATADPAHLRDNMAALRGPQPDQALRMRIAAECR